MKALQLFGFLLKQQTVPIFAVMITLGSIGGLFGRFYFDNYVQTENDDVYNILIMIGVIVGLYVGFRLGVAFMSKNFGLHEIVQCLFSRN